MFVAQNAHTVTIALTDAEMSAARSFAERIEMANRKNKRRNVQGLRVSPQRSLEIRISGSYGDAAVAKALGMPAERVADHWRTRPDVGKYDVFTTTLERGCLIFTPRDVLIMRKVLVIDCAPLMHVCGWYECEDAREHPRDLTGKNPLFRTEREGGGAWYVPQHMLKPLPELQR